MPLDFPSSPALNDSYTFGGITWRWNGSGWQTISTTGIGLIRAQAQVTISALANGATGTGNITLPKSSVLLSIGTSRAAWVRIYSSATASSDDSARTRTTAPSAGAGVIADVVTTGAQTIEMEPAPSAANRESPVTTTFPVRVANDGSTGDVVITVAYLTLEN